MQVLLTPALQAGIDGTTFLTNASHASLFKLPSGLAYVYDLVAILLGEALGAVLPGYLARLVI